MDGYAKRWVQAIKKAGDNEELLAAIVDKVYEQGFEDGVNNLEDV